MKTIIDELSELEDTIIVRSNELDELKAEYNKKHKLVEESSEFESKLIGPAIAKLITRISGREFEYKRVISTCPRIYGGNYEIISRDELLVVDKEKYKNHYSSNYGDPTYTLAKSGEAIILATAADRIITFYKYGTREWKDGRIFWFFGFDVELYGNFDYVKEFIDKLIDYRLKNRLEKITEDDINTFMDEFIEKYQQPTQGSRLSLTNEAKGE